MRVVQNDAACSYIVIPLAPAGLSDEVLDSVAGGWGSFPENNCPPRMRVSVQTYFFMPSWGATHGPPVTLQPGEPAIGSLKPNAPPTCADEPIGILVMICTPPATVPGLIAQLGADQKDIERRQGPRSLAPARRFGADKRRGRQVQVRPPVHKEGKKQRRQIL